jgi:hypothetical protein
MMISFCTFLLLPVSDFLLNFAANYGTRTETENRGRHHQDAQDGL